MSDKIETAQATEVAQDEKGKSAQGVVDYLQAPRKKRKSFIVIAKGPSTDNDTFQAMVRYAKASFPKFSVATPQTTEEFTRQFSRNIVLAIMDDNFLELEATLDLIKTMKEKKNESAIPVLFMTRDPDSLIRAYSKKLAAWQEVDEYIVPAATPRQYLYAKIKSGVEERYRRRSRRYKVQFPIVYSVLDYGERRFRGTVLDMSVHGILLKTDEDHIFTPKDQIMIHLPIGSYVKSAGADIIRVPARVRRIYISGDMAGLSWEHLTEQKISNISEMLLHIVDISLVRSASAARARIAKAEADAIAANPRATPVKKEKEKDKEKDNKEKE